MKRNLKLLRFSALSAIGFCWLLNACSGGVAPGSGGNTPVTLNAAAPTYDAGVVLPVTENDGPGTVTIQVDSKTQAEPESTNPGEENKGGKISVTGLLRCSSKKAHEVCQSGNILRLWAKGSGKYIEVPLLQPEGEAWKFEANFTASPELMTEVLKALKQPTKVFFFGLRGKLPYQAPQNNVEWACDNMADCLPKEEWLLEKYSNPYEYKPEYANDPKPEIIIEPAPVIPLGNPPPADSGDSPPELNPKLKPPVNLNF